jgi:dipeptidyl aminopeptidase/acylaminoacyl peptidase
MNKRMMNRLALGLLLLALAFSMGWAQLPDLIPRSVFFSNPQKAGLEISPDGQRLAYLAPSPQGVLNVWVQTLGKEDAVQVTNDKHRGIRSYGWIADGRRLAYIQDLDGDENFHLYLVDLQTKVVRDLTPFQGIRAQNFILNKKFPDQALVGLNLRNRQLFDMYRINLNSGAVELDTENPGTVVGWSADDTLTIRAATVLNPQDGSTVIRVRDAKDKPWRDLMVFPFGENGNLLDISLDGQSAYIDSSLGSDTSRLIQVDLKTGQEIKAIASNPQCDLGYAIIHPDRHEVQAVVFDYLMPAYTILDPSIKEDIAFLQKAHPGVVSLNDRDNADQKWVVSYMVDDGPISSYIYNRGTKALDFVFENRPDLKKYKLAKMQPVVIKARDGFNLVSYLTLPVGLKPEKLPMVLFVHGGPWGRDSWGYSGYIQFLVNRGYAVLQVNFRGSAGFGKKFLNAGNLEWGVGKMQQDLTDAVKWAIKQGYADPGKVAIMGGSYGGYATLAGLTFTPELYCCGVDIVGPSHIKTLLQSIPPYWAPMKKMFQLRVGDVEKDDVFDQKISPLFHVDAIRAPLLIGQGKNDPRVNIRESDQIVEAVRARKLPVKYIVYSDEGHGFARPENNLDFTGYVDEFLAKYLGGRFEPYKQVKGAAGEEH